MEFMVELPFEVKRTVENLKPEWHASREMCSMTNRQYVDSIHLAYERIKIMSYFLRSTRVIR